MHLFLENQTVDDQQKTNSNFSGWQSAGARGERGGFRNGKRGCKRETWVRMSPSKMFIITTVMVSKLIVLQHSSVIRDEFQGARRVQLRM